MGNISLGALAESAFDPLSRTCRFMLIEEAHHLSVGQKGISEFYNVLSNLKKQIQMEMFAVKVVLIFKPFKSTSIIGSLIVLDLFGSEISNNAAEFLHLV